MNNYKYINDKLNCIFSNGKINYKKKEVDQNVKDIKNRYDSLSQSNSDDLIIDIVKYVFNDNDVFLPKFKNLGIFRYNKKYKNFVICLSNIFIKNKNKVFFKISDIKFIESVLLFKDLFDQKIKMEKEIEREVKHRNDILKLKNVRYNIVATLFAYLEIKFLEVNYNMPEVSLDINNFNIFEEIEAISYLVYKNKELGYEKNKSFANFEFLKSKKLQRMIYLARQIRKIDEYEKMIELLNYNMTKTLKGFSFEFINKSSGINYRKGFVKYDFEMFNRGYKNKELFKNDVLGKLFTGIKKVEFISEKFKDSFNYPRLTWEIPEVIIDEITSLDILPKERAFIMSEVDDFKINQDLLKAEFYEGISLIDVFRTNRFFKFIHEYISKGLYEKYINKSINEEVFVNSLPVTIDMKMNKGLISNNFKIDKIIDLFSHSKSVLDLYYTPITRHINEIISFVPGIICSQNIVRNTIKIVNKFPHSIFHSDGSNDFLIKEFVDTFTELKIKHKVNINIKSTDIDVAFQIDNVLFITECKNNFHPSDIYECKTTLDSINYAILQLDKIGEYFKNTGNVNKIGFSFYFLNFPFHLFCF
jgi:hypothetical protein